MTDFTTKLDECLTSKGIPVLGYESPAATLHALNETYSAWAKLGSKNEVTTGEVAPALGIGELGMAPGYDEFFKMPVSPFIDKLIACLVAVDLEGARAAFSTEPPLLYIIERFPE